MMNNTTALSLYLLTIETALVPVIGHRIGVKHRICTVGVTKYSTNNQKKRK